MGNKGLLLLIGFKILIIMTSLQNIAYLDAQGLLMSMGSKFLIKITRPQNIEMECFVAWSTLLKSGICSDVMMIKILIFNPIKSRSPFWFYIFFNKAFLVLGCFFLHPGCFWFRFHFFFIWSSEKVKCRQFI